MSIDGWMDKEDAHNLNNGMLLSHKKEWNLDIYDNMTGPWRYYAKDNKSDREGQLPYAFTQTQNLNKQTNIQNETKKTSLIKRSD